MFTLASPRRSTKLAAQRASVINQTSIGFMPVEWEYSIWRTAQAGFCSIGLSFSNFLM
jgi:hypothetical protein